MTELDEIGGESRVIIRYTDKGQPYQYDPALDDPALEHVREKLPITAKLHEIEERYGAGTRLYFSFLKYVAFTNILLAGLGLVSWVPYILDDGGAPTYGQLFVGSYYLQQHSLYWWASGVVAMAVWFIVATIYSCWAFKWFTPLPVHDNAWAMNHNDSITANQNVSRSERNGRTFGIYLLTFLIIGCTSALLYGLINLQNFLQDRYRSAFATLTNLVSIEIALSGGVAVILVLLNAIWIPASAALTRLEKHRTWSSFRTHNGFKLILFKLINATVLYTLIGTVLKPAPGTAQCTLNDAGSKFFLLLVVDIVFVNLAQMIAPALKRCCIFRCHCECLRGKGGDEDMRPEFDLAEEYLQILYRQWLLYLGTLTFPLVGLLGFLANLIEYPLDKYRMLRVCQEPKRIDSKMAHFLTFFLFIVGITSLISYPNGSLWLLFLPNLTPVGYQDCSVFTFWRNFTSA